MEQQAWKLGMEILSCFAEKLAMDRGFLMDRPVYR